MILTKAIPATTVAGPIHHSQRRLRGNLEHGMKDWSHSWYTPGDWSLPLWWTNGPPVRGDQRATRAEQAVFYSSWFAVDVLKHTGGMTTPPATTRSVA